MLTHQRAAPIVADAAQNQLKHAEPFNRVSYGRHHPYEVLQTKLVFRYALTHPIP